MVETSKSERILSRAGTVFCQAEVCRKQTDAPDLEATVSDIESRCSRQNPTRSGTQALCAQVAPQRRLSHHRGQKPVSQNGTECRNLKSSAHLMVCGSSYLSSISSIYMVRSSLDISSSSPLSKRSPYA